MHYFKYADKDATLYELSASLNSGIDEILTITKNIDPTSLSSNEGVVGVTARLGL